MCGINLIVDRTGNVKSASLKQMMDITMHRGPDSSHTRIIRYKDRHLYFGTNRLKIIDHSEASDQPFSDQSGQHFLLYNGEIYNPEGIRNQLVREGIQFRTFSDTEVLFHSLKKRGSTGISSINGMFAFVFINLDNQFLTIGRDPWGMKPLYYYLDDRHFILSSEIRGILASGLVTKELNTLQIPHYLRFRYTKLPYTLFKNIYQFEKGSVYRFNLVDFKLEKEPSSSDSIFEEPITGEKQILNHVEELILDSLMTHTKSAHPVGIFLSGGVDSTLLLALSSRYDIPLPHVFSMVNREQDREFGTEDYKYVEKAVRQYHSSAEIVEADESLMDDIEDLIGEMDHPIADPAYLLTYKLSVGAARKTRVIISGAGGDELFVGYNRQMAFYKYLRYYQKIKRIIPMMKNLNRSIPSELFLVGRKKMVLLKKLLHKMEIDPWLTYDNFLSFEKLHPVLDENIREIESPDNFLSHYMTMAIERDRQEYLPEDVLAVNDRAGMLASIEMRMPYLDRQVTSYVRQIPVDVLLSRGQKWILKELLRKYDGDAFTRRPKEGFGFPFGYWIRRPAHKNILQEISRENNRIYRFMDRDKFLKLIHDHDNGKEDNAQEIWSVLVLTRWIEKNFN